MIRNKYLSAFIAVVLIYSATANKGCVELDELTFDKVVKKFQVVIVKFDIAYPYGEKHEAYIQFADDVHSVSNLLVTVVGIKDYGDKDNANLGKRFSVGEGYPKIKLFINGKTDSWIDYTEGTFSEHFQLSLNYLNNFFFACRFNII